MQARSATRKAVKRRRIRRSTLAKIYLLVILLALVGIGLFVVERIMRINKNVPDTASDLHYSLKIDGEDVSNLSSSEAIDLLQKKYPWSITVTHGEDTFPVDNLIAPIINSTVSQAYRDAATLPKEDNEASFIDKLFNKDVKNEPKDLSYELKMPSGDELARSIAEKLSEEAGSSVQNCSITSYDPETDSFILSEGKSGKAIDVEKLERDIATAINSGDFQATIQAEEVNVSPTITAEDYKTMGAYTTNTTAKKDRNTNVRLAAEAVNGTILAPGEQFSFNETVGERTEEKGYKPAPAYAEGQTVQEFGGGVCQVSSTLYNAVIAAGLQTDARVGHTFEPTYVTPGQDATVSYPNPDFKFTNNSEATIGIKAVYHDQVMHVELYGVPLLEEGTKRYLKSEQTEEVEPPAPTYIEDPSVPFGTEVVQKAGSNGSTWTTNIVVEKNGEIIEDEYLHQTRYKGHSGVVKRNTQYPNAVVLPDGTVVDANALNQAAAAAAAAAAAQQAAAQQAAQQQAAPQQ